MSEQVNPVPAEETESSSGLLLSVEPLENSHKLYATDTVDDGADSDVTGADTDTTDKSDSDGTDSPDTDGTDAGSDSDGTDTTDSDGSDTVDADGTDSR